MIGPSIDTARKAYAAVQEARRAVDIEVSKEAQYRLERSKGADEIVRLREDEIGDAARRILDGPGAAPEKPRRQSRIRKLEEEAPALEAAITLQRGRIQAAKEAVAPLLPPLAAASLELVRAVHGDALSQVADALAHLAEPAARLLAADHIMAATVGTEGVPIPRGVPAPVNGARLLENLLKSIPPNVRPKALDAESLAAAARAISQPIIAQVKGK